MLSKKLLSTHLEGNGLKKGQVTESRLYKYEESSQIGNQVFLAPNYVLLALHINHII